MDAEALIEDPSLSIEEGVFGSFFGKSNYYPQIFRALCEYLLGVDAATPWMPWRISGASSSMAWAIRRCASTTARRTVAIPAGIRSIPTVRNILYERYIETTNEKTKARLERYIREEPCAACHGARLRPEMLAVTVGGASIYDVCRMSCRESLGFFEGLELTERQEFIGGRIVKEILDACASSST